MTEQERNIEINELTLVRTHLELAETREETESQL